MGPLRWDLMLDMSAFLSIPPRQGGNLLDIGRGVGFFVKTAREKEFKGHGIEFDKRFVMSGRESFALDTIYSLDIDGFSSFFSGVELIKSSSVVLLPFVSYIEACSKS
jgi:hypothetical protein